MEISNNQSIHKKNYKMFSARSNISRNFMYIVFYMHGYSIDEKKSKIVSN